MSAPTDGERSATTFRIPGMDCPSEERLVRMALEPHDDVATLDFDLDARTLKVVHTGEADDVLHRLEPLGFGAVLESSEPADESEVEGEPGDPAAERRVLKQLLAINATMFVVELVMGIVAGSTGLLGDALDMLADAGVYSLSLYAVGRAATAKRRAAKTSGVLQILLALGVLGEVVRRAVVGSEPAELLMIVVSAVALLANLGCVALLAKHREGGVHLKASWIFSTNDALVNLGVIAAGILVAITNTAWPDLVIGTIVGLIVLSGAVRILRLE